MSAAAGSIVIRTEMNMSQAPRESENQDRITREKAALRASTLPLRRALTNEFKTAAASQVCELVVASPEFSNAESVALYAATADELPVRGLFDAGIRAGKRCLLPRCDSGAGLEFAEVTSWESLQPGAFGILEPDPGLLACRLLPGDLAILPGLAFDLGGGRLGRGKGYYDRAFPVGTTGSCSLFGVAFSLQIVAEVPIGLLDRQVDAVVTEAGLVRCDGDERG